MDNNSHIHIKARIALAAIELMAKATLTPKTLMFLSLESTLEYESRAEHFQTPRCGQTPEGFRSRRALTEPFGAAVDTESEVKASGKPTWQHRHKIYF